MNYNQQLILLCNHLSCSLRPPATPLSNFDDLRGSSQWKTKGKMEIDFSCSADRPRWFSSSSGRNIEFFLAQSTSPTDTLKCRQEIVVVVPNSVSTASLSFSIDFHCVLAPWLSQVAWVLFNTHELSQMQGNLTNGGQSLPYVKLGTKLRLEVKIHEVTIIWGLWTLITQLLGT